MEITAKFKGYCNRCHYTVWRGEKVWLQGKVRHLDCAAALKDKSARVLTIATSHLRRRQEEVAAQGP